MTLPNPSSQAQAMSQQLTQQLQRLILASPRQSISFHEYMNRALYEPGLGYYHNGLQKWGAEGDYITAPELSPLFANTLANQVGQVFTLLAPNDSSTLLEFGAGSGILCADLLTALEQNDQLPERYYIVELSAELQGRQRNTVMAKCPHLLPRVKWLTHLPDKPFSGVVIANEVLDAMPIEKYELTDQGVFESRVVVRPDSPSFQEALSPMTKLEAVSHAPEELRLIIHALTHTLSRDQLHTGYTIELNPAIRPWLQSLSDCLFSGLVLFMDYGFPRQEYYHPERSMGTLMCHAAHHSHGNVFWHPGLQDITAHVDFTGVAEGGIQAGFEVAGYLSQANFLMNCGVLNEYETLRTDVNLPLRQAFNTLTLPSEMGELFKVIGLRKGLTGLDDPLLGFSPGDRTGRL